MTLNDKYYNSLGATWQNKIATHAYKVGGMSSSNISTVQEYYIEEVGSGSSSTTESMEIGLMYVSDYGYAASPEYWTIEMFYYNGAMDNNWMYLGSDEWTISRRSNFSHGGWLVDSWGHVFGGNSVAYAYAVRPAFYLNSGVTYSSGSGTQSNPIRIN